MINIVTSDDFVNMRSLLNHVWTKNLPFSTTYRTILMEKLHKLKILDKSDFCYPTKIIEVMGTKKFNEEVPETTRKILLKGLLALERQLERQKELYGNDENLFEIDIEKKMELISLNRESIYNGFRVKMHNGFLFIPTGNKIYNGDYSFKSDVLDNILAHYSTLPKLASGDFSEFDELFIVGPKSYSYRQKRNKKGK